MRSTLRALATAIVAALCVLALTASPAVGATVTDSCRPFTTGPTGQISVYPYGAGRQVHYATFDGGPWDVYRVYVNGIRVYPATEGYANLPDRRAITVKHVWRHFLSGLTDSCTNTA